MRIAQRWAAAPHETYPMTEAEVDSWREQFEEPDPAQTTGPLAEAPEPWTSWLAWAQGRWPWLTA